MAACVACGFDAGVADELHHVGDAGGVVDGAGQGVALEAPSLEACGLLEPVADGIVLDEQAEFGFVAATHEGGFQLGVGGQPGHHDGDRLLVAGEMLEGVAEFVDFGTGGLVDLVDGDKQTVGAGHQVFERGSQVTPAQVVVGVVPADTSTDADHGGVDGGDASAGRLQLSVEFAELTDDAFTEGTGLGAGVDGDAVPAIFAGDVFDGVEEHGLAGTAGGREVRPAVDIGGGFGREGVAVPLEDAVTTDEDAGREAPAWGERVHRNHPRCISRCIRTLAVGAPAAAVSVRVEALVGWWARFMETGWGVV